MLCVCCCMLVFCCTEYAAYKRIGTATLTHRLESCSCTQNLAYVNNITPKRALSPMQVTGKALFVMHQSLSESNQYHFVCEQSLYEVKTQVTTVNNNMLLLLLVCVVCTTCAHTRSHRYYRRHYNTL
jgi:hypothetical protein